MRKTYETTACGVTIFADVISMGRDYTICIYDDKNGHIGSTAVSSARMSRTGEGISATTSVVNGSGHKEETIARSFSESFAVWGNCTAVCTCGIHIEDITEEQIRQILSACEQLKRKILGIN